MQNAFENSKAFCIYTPCHFERHEAEPEHGVRRNPIAADKQCC